MIKRRLYTALYLLGIFVYPIIFQPWHIIQHHGHIIQQHDHDHGCSGHSHEADKSYEHAHHHDPKYPDASVLHFVNIKTHDHSHDPCYICDFKFPVNNLPSSNEPGFISHQHKETLAVNLVFSELQEVYFLINSRAPPGACSILS
jgi:hypothetical protein